MLAGLESAAGLETARRDGLVQDITVQTENIAQIGLARQCDQDPVVRSPETSSDTIIYPSRNHTTDKGRTRVLHVELPQRIAHILHHVPIRVVAGRTSDIVVDRGKRIRHRRWYDDKTGSQQNERCPCLPWLGNHGRTSLF